jgi:hypothetical protein
MLYRVLPSIFLGPWSVPDVSNRFEAANPHTYKAIKGLERFFLPC